MNLRKMMLPLMALAALLVLAGAACGGGKSEEERLLEELFGDLEGLEDLEDLDFEDLFENLDGLGFGGGSGSGEVVIGGVSYPFEVTTCWMDRDEDGHWADMLGRGTTGDGTPFWVSVSWWDDDFGERLSTDLVLGAESLFEQGDVNWSSYDLDGDVNVGSSDFSVRASGQFDAFTDDVFVEEAGTVEARCER